MIKLIVCSTGTGLTAGSRVFVKKSKNIFGQKNASSAAAIWSAGLVSLGHLKKKEKKKKEASPGESGVGGTHRLLP